MAALCYDTCVTIVKTTILQATGIEFGTNHKIWRVIASLGVISLEMDLIVFNKTLPNQI